MNFCLARANTVLLCVCKCMITPDIQCPIILYTGWSQYERERGAEMEKTGEKGRGVGGRKRETERQTEREKGGGS